MGCNNSANREESKKGRSAVQVKNFIGVHSDLIIDDYNLDKILGSGAYGVVRKGTSKTTKAQVAIKQLIIQKESQRKLALKEFQILKSLDHPNIMKIYGLYQNKHQNQIMIVTELLKGGSLFDSVLKNYKALNQGRLASIVKQILVGIAYLHSKKIVHRDLKPENILLISKESGETFVKIVDFGLAAYVDRDINTGAGTPLYVPPEMILGKKYRQKVDIWSLGVIVYVLLSGAPPFKGRNRQQLFDSIIDANPSYKQRHWDIISREARNFVQSCLIFKPEKRPSAVNLLKHPWIQNFATNEEMTVEMQQNLLEELHRFSKSSVLQHAVFNFLSLTQVSNRQAKQLKTVFQQFDSNKDGTLTKTQLIEGIDKICGKEFRLQKDIEAIIQGLDLNNDQRIEYSQFLSALLELHNGISQQQLMTAFNFFDRDRTGSITREDLKDVFIAAGEEDVQRAWQQIIDQVDQNNDGKIQFDEFKLILKRNISNKNKE